MKELTRKLINVLRADAVRHTQGDFLKLGSEFDEVELYRSKHPNLESTRTIGIALTFWDAWIDQVRHGFGQNFYKGIQPGHWPHLATDIANHLESGTAVTNAIVIEHFDSSSPQN